MPAPRPKNFTISSMDPDLNAAGAFEFCANAYPNTPIVAGIRELILRGLGTDLTDAAVAAARRAAFYITVSAMRAAIGEAFTRAADEFRAEAMIARANYEAAVQEGVAIELRKRGIEP
jgi:hypothetical protein